MDKNKLPSVRKVFYTLTIFSVLMFSCAPNGEEKEERIDDTETQEITNELSKQTLDKVKVIFFSLPSPVETALLFEDSGTEYNEELLNPVDNSVSYVSSKSKALNLGVYSADLSYASIYKQTQTTITYLNETKKLADELGILDAIDEETFEKIKQNMDNRNTLMNIIAETFMNSNSYLTENNRLALAALVVVGGWVETLYIATQLSDKSTENQQLVDIVISQKWTIEDMIELLKIYEENNDIEIVLNDIKELKVIFDEVELISSASQVTQTEDETVVSTDNVTSVSPEVFAKLCDKVEQIRNRYIQ